MPTATKTPTTPSRSTIGFGVAAFAAGLTVPALASAAEPDAELIRLCNQMLANETELWLLTDHDENAPDFGPNRAHYDRLDNERNRLKELVDECGHPVSAGGTVAIARVALTWVERDSQGLAMSDHFGEEVMLRLAEAVSAGFVWPPRPGGCSTARWALPPSAKEVAEHHAAHKAKIAKITAKIEAERLAAKAEDIRRAIPCLLTDDELRGRAVASRELKAIAAMCAGKLDAEMTRRGLVT